MLKPFIATALVASGLIGCVDPRGSFDDFDHRAGTTDASTIDRPMSTLADISGTFLLGVRGGFEPSNDPAFYIQMIVEWDLELTGETGVLDGSFMPLCVHASCNGVRNMLPPAFIANDRAVASDGTFQQPVAGMLPGGANPFSGTEQPLDGNLDATIISTDLVCGAITGTAAGLDLTGSTFAAIRITNTSPPMLPAPIAACPSGGQDAGVDAPIDAP